MWRGKARRCPSTVSIPLPSATSAPVVGPAAPPPYPALPYASGRLTEVPSSGGTAIGLRRATVHSRQTTAKTSLSLDGMVQVIEVVSSPGYPLVVTPEDAAVPDGPSSLATWVTNYRSDMTAWLSSIGAVLFRGFNVTTPEDYRSVALAAFPELRSYVGGDAPRSSVLDRIYEATSFSATDHLALHNELSYSGWWPTMLSFCCIQPAQRGGETTIADSRRVFRKIPEAVRRPFLDLGVTYHQHLRDESADSSIGKSWQATFQTTSRRAVEEYCRRNGMEYQWTSLGLRTSRTNPGALVELFPNSPPCWFNQADFWRAGFDPLKEREADPGVYDIEERLGCDAHFGDGTEIPMAFLVEVRQAYRDCEVAVNWQVGDVLLIDNRLAMHGRRPFEGQRHILVAMS